MMANGYLRSLEDFRSIPLRSDKSGVSVLLSEIARVQLGPEMRRGIAELNGEGEVVGGVIRTIYSASASSRTELPASPFARCTAAITWLWVMP